MRFISAIPVLPPDHLELPRDVILDVRSALMLQPEDVLSHTELPGIPRKSRVAVYGGANRLRQERDSRRRLPKRGSTFARHGGAMS